MRIIAGEYGGRRLKSLDGQHTRPTTDKVKESIFNIIGPYFAGGTCLDLFSGSGALAIEAVSRGMDYAVLFEKDRRAQQVILENIQLTKEVDKFHLIKADSQKADIPVQSVDLVFLDPPYQKQQIVKDLERLLANGILSKQAIAVCETDAKIVLPDTIQTLHCWKRVVYGTIAVAFYENQTEEE